jgi:hypothetical protein
MPVSTAGKTSNYARVVLVDGTTPTPLTLTLLFDMGDVSLANMGQSSNELVHLTRRGRYISTAHGDRKFPTITFSEMQVEKASSTNAGAALDFMKKLGAHSSNASTGGSGSKRPYAFNLRYETEGTDFGDDADGTTTFERCYLMDFSFTEGQPNSFSFTVECCGAVTGDLAQSEFSLS